MTAAFLKGGFVVGILVKLALAATFSGACAYAYLKLARRRRNVQRESRMVFGALFVFTLLRLLSIE